MLQNLPDNFKIVEIFDKSGHTEWTTLSAAVGRDRKVSICAETQVFSGFHGRLHIV